MISSFLASFFFVLPFWPIPLYSLRYVGLSSLLCTVSSFNHSCRKLQRHVTTEDIKVNFTSSYFIRIQYTAAFSPPVPLFVFSTLSYLVRKARGRSRHHDTLSSVSLLSFVRFSFHRFPFFTSLRLLIFLRY